VPADVAASLDGRDDDPSWELRDRLIDVVPAGVIASLKRIASARSWTLREKWIASRGGETAVAASFELARTLCESLNGVDDERSWDLRKLVKDTAPVPYLASMGGLSSDRAWKQRGRFLDRAPKVVLRTIAGLDDDRAWDLRERAAMRVKEAIDSMIGLDGDRAWTLRDRCADVWPSTVVKSLGPLARGQRGTALVARQLGRYPGNVSLLKHAAAIELGADLAAVDGAE
jgi:dTMP kinase